MIRYTRNNIIQDIVTNIMNEARLLALKVWN
jgi:hypothetical protein